MDDKCLEELRGKISDRFRGNDLAGLGKKGLDRFRGNDLEGLGKKGLDRFSTPGISNRVF